MSIMHPDGGRFIFDDVDMGFYKRESNQKSYYIIDFDENAVGDIHKCLSLKSKYHQEKIEKIPQKC